MVIVQALFEKKIKTYGANLRNELLPKKELIYQCNSAFTGFSNRKALQNKSVFVSAGP